MSNWDNVVECLGCLVGVTLMGLLSWGLGVG